MGSLTCKTNNNSVSENNKMVDESSSDGQESKIGQFYADKSVFITGATGFMGKVKSVQIATFEVETCDV